MIFEYNNQLLPQNLIDINDFGQCCLECSNEDGFYYYIIIKTTMGTTTIATCGPVVPDVDLLPSGFMTTLKRMDFKEDKVCKELKTFLNDKKKITEAKEIPFDQAIDNFRELSQYLRDGGY